MEKKTVEFIKSDGFTKVGYRAHYPADKADALIRKGAAKLVEKPLPPAGKLTRDIKTVEKTSEGGKPKATKEF
jgi:hypothetical protein